jgi:hypothetical protein
MPRFPASLLGAVALLVVLPGCQATPQFRREIGKYVNEAEVARLERYVRIP